MTIDGEGYIAAFKPLGATPHGREDIAIPSPTTKTFPDVHDSGIPLVEVRRKNGIPLTGGDRAIALSVARNSCMRNPDWKHTIALGDLAGDAQTVSKYIAYKEAAFLLNGRWSFYSICE